MSTENLEIVIDATVQNAVKAVKDIVVALDDVPASATRASGAMGKFTDDELRVPTMMRYVENVKKVKESLETLPSSLVNAEAAAGKLSNTIEDLRAHILIRQAKIIESDDISKIALYNKEIEQLSEELIRLSNVGKKGFDNLGNKLATPPKISKADEKAVLDLSNDYKQLSIAYQEAIDKARNLALQQGVGSEAARNAAIEVKALGSKLKEVNSTFVVADEKIEKTGKTVEKTAKQSNALGKGFSFIRQAAYLLPGIGIAGIFNEIGVAVAALIGELAKGSGHFEEMATIIGNSAEEAYKAKEKFTGFIDRITDSGTSLKAQKDALKEANKALAEYGIQIDSVSAAQKNGVVLSGLYADAKREEAKQIAFSALAAKEFAKQAELSFTAQKGGLVDVVKQVGVVNLLKNAFKNFGSVAVGVTGTVGGFSQTVTESTDKQKFFEDQIDQSKTKLEAIVGIMQMFGSKSQDTAKKGKEMSNFVENLRVKLGELQDIADKDPFAKITAGTAKLINQFNDLKSKGKLTAQDIIDAPGIIAAIDKLERDDLNIELFNNETKTAAKKSAENWALVYKESLNKALSQIVPAIPKISSEDAMKSLKNALAGIDEQMTKLGLLTTTQLKSFSDQYTATLRDIAASAATAIGDGIASAVTGMGNPFASLINVLGAGLKALGQMYIKIGVEMLIAQKAIKAIANNPYLTIAAGIALQALGSILQQKAQSQTKLAEGGIVSGPMSAQIGEAGQSEVILPLSRLSGLLSNNRGMVVMETRVSGQDLLLVQARAAGSRGRTYG